MSDERKLSDADIQALAKALKNEFYVNLGKGVWSLAWKAIVVAVIVVAAYGSTKGFKLP